MRQTFFLTSVLLVLLSFAVAYSRTATTSENYGLEVNIAPEQNSAGIFQAKMVVTNLTTSKIVTAPTIRIPAGESARTTTSIGSTLFDFSVAVDRSSSVAEYEVQGTEGSSVVCHWKSKISLSHQ